MENQNQQNRILVWLNQSLTVKMVVVGILLLVLLIPLYFVQNLIAERAQRQEEVIAEINQKWGGEHIISGPILKIPYVKRTLTPTIDPNSKESKNSLQTSVSFVYFLPEKLKGSCQLDVKKLKRSIYESAVYEGSLVLDGILAQPDLASEDIKEEDVLWEKSTVIIQTSNLKGIKNNLFLKLGEKTLSLTPKLENQNSTNFTSMQSLETDQFDFREIKNKAFEFNLLFNGSEQFRIIPVAKQTQLNMKSNWTSPSFIGEYLPKNESEKLTKEGFNANWEILFYNRPFSQSFLDALPDLSAYSFGVNLVVPVDEYQKSERSAKYGFLVISFTFLFFFLIQAVRSINIHPFQYLLIGLALVMFYTLLISISEHSSFLIAYWIASLSVILLIGWYAASILKNKKFATFVSISLAALYTFIYVIIQLENYALLVGSIGLFLILGIVMYVSRKIVWK